MQFETTKCSEEHLFQHGALHFGRIFDDAMPYRFTTEDIAAYLPHLNVAGARCLTVAGSGDQAVDLLAAGADEVVIFDRMRNAIAATDLKLTTLRDWPGTMEDFMRSFGKQWPRSHVTKRRTFGTEEGSDASQNLEAIDRNGFRLPFFKRGMISGAADYLDTEEKFQSARRAIDDALGHGRVRSFQADIRDLAYTPDLGTFDVIVLSNVVSTLVHHTRHPPQTHHGVGRDMFPERDELERVKAIHADTAWRAARFLRPGGAMMADFLYGVNGYGYPYNEDHTSHVRPEGWVAPPMTVEEIEKEEAELQAGLDDVAAHRRHRQEEWSAPPGYTVSEVMTGERSMGGHDVAIIVRREADPAYDRNSANRARYNPPLHDHTAAFWKARHEFFQSSTTLVD